MHPTSYDWEFIPVAGKTFTDSGSAPCVLPPSVNLPLALDDAKTTSEDLGVNVPVLINDDFGGDGPLPGTITVLTQPANGTAAVNAGITPTNPTDDTIDYTPNANYYGADSFTYQICDATGDCDPATVTITVTPVDDDPPVANDDTPITQQDTLVNINVAANDSDPDGNLDLTSTNNTCAITCSGPANGNLVNVGNGTFNYTPNPGYIGPDSFVYQICDSGIIPIRCDTASVAITVTEPNDPPVAKDDSPNTPEDTPLTIDAAGNDNDPDGNLDPTSTNNLCATCTAPANGNLVNIGGGNFNYTPNLNFNGGDSFVYEICDLLGLCDTATVNITVNSVNDAPLALDDSASTGEDTLWAIDVAANDSDLDGDLDPASINTLCATCIPPKKGSLVKSGNGIFDYTPNPGYIGPDGFVYEICDSGSPKLCDTASVSITVTPVPDPPLAQDDTASTKEDTTVLINVAANDSDPDGDMDPATADTSCPTCYEPAKGTLYDNADGTFDYTPDLNFNGSDNFVYEICDVLAACDTAVVSITVDPVADPLVAVDDTASTQEDKFVRIDVAGQ